MLTLRESMPPSQSMPRGGPGNIRGNPPRGSLEVQQTERIHQELTRLLTLLRQTPRR